MDRRTFLRRISSLVVAGGDSRFTAAPLLKGLRQVDDLKNLFNTDKGQPRIVLLLSPT